MQMKAINLAATALALSFALAGCASQSSWSGKSNTSKLASMSCTDLNAAMGAISKDISATAISRGKVSSWNVPFWAAGGTKAKTVIQDRQTAKIERMQQEQRDIEAIRKNTCSGQM